MINRLLPRRLWSAGSPSAGFTLIEMAIVLIVAGIVISIIASVLPSLIQSGKIRQGRAGLERFDYALQGYVTATGRLPCPDTDENGEEDRITGEPSPANDSCAAYVGDLPYKTLGLSSGDDSWANPVKYAVYADLVTTSSETGSNPFCSRMREIIKSYDPAEAEFRTADTGKLYVSDANGQNPKNKAYILVSGGPKDLDGDRRDALFDGLNEGRDLSFEAADRNAFYGEPVNRRYDDLVRTASFTFISGKIGCGTADSAGVPPGSDGGGEYQEPGDCEDTIDNDGDGFTDCEDQDCAGKDDCPEGGSEVGILTQTIPDGNTGCAYSTTFEATGGTPNYEWELTNDGGFPPPFDISPYTGVLSGNLEQCPGDYPIEVRVTDATPVSEGGPTTDTKAYTLRVGTDLNINRTSGSGSAITWNDPYQVETFQATGCFRGAIDWTLDSGGAPGFSVTPTGTSTCSIQHSGTNPGTYSFRLTAADSVCPGSNTATLSFVVTITVTGGTVPIPPSVAAHWQMDECTWNGTPDEVQDANGTVNGTARNGARTAGAGKICRSGFFDGSNDYVDMGDALNTPLGSASNTFTVAAWINPLALTTNRTNHQTANCFVAKASDPINDNLEIGVNPNGSIHVYIDTAGQDRYDDFGPANAVRLGRWSFVALRYDDGEVTVSVDGASYTNTTTWAGGGNLDSAAGSPFTIGSSQHINNYFNGRIDEVFVFTAAISDSEIDTLRTTTRPSCSGPCYTGAVAEYRMDAASWSGTGTTADVIDSSGGGFNGTSFHGIDTTADGYLCRGGAFTDSGVDDVNDRIRLPGQVADNLNDFTVTAWLRTAKNGQQAVVSGANASQNNEFLFFFNNGSNFRPFIRGTSRNYSVSIADNSWHHVVWMRDGNVEVVVVDGTSIGNTSVSAASLSIPANGLWLGSEQDAVAGNWDSSQEFVGTMDEVTFYDRALGENEIDALINLTRTCN